KYDEICVCFLGIKGVLNVVSRNTEKLDERTHTMSRQTVARKVDTVYFSRQCDVQTIIDEHPGLGSGSKIANSAYQVEEFAGRQVFFTDLDHFDPVADRAFSRSEDVA